MITLNRNEIFVSHCIRNALLGEVYTTPKPGLVDRQDTGAHTDMDVRTFEASTEAIVPGLTRMFAEGYGWRSTPKQLFLKIREIGRETEKAMFDATGGINTHKGLIFTLGILNASAGFCWKQEQSLDISKVFEMSRRMTEEILEEEFCRIQRRRPVSHGEKLYHLYGCRGIRGEAQNGFPVLRDVAWPVLRNFRQMGMEENASHIQVLLAVMAELEDTNVLSRGSAKDLLWLKKEAGRIMQEGGVFTAAGRKHLATFNTACIHKNISPGGAADYLAAAIFLWNLEKGTDWLKNEQSEGGKRACRRPKEPWSYPESDSESYDPW